MRKPIYLVFYLVLLTSSFFSCQRIHFRWSKGYNMTALAFLLRPMPGYIRRMEKTKGGRGEYSSVDCHFACLVEVRRTKIWGFLWSRNWTGDTSSSVQITETVGRGMSCVVVSTRCYINTKMRVWQRGNLGEVLTRCEDGNPRNEVESPRDEANRPPKRKWKIFQLEAPLVDQIYHECWIIFFKIGSTARWSNRSRAKNRAKTVKIWQLMIIGYFSFIK